MSRELKRQTMNKSMRQAPAAINSTCLGNGQTNEQTKRQTERLCNCIKTPLFQRGLNDQRLVNQEKLHIDNQPVKAVLSHVSNELVFTDDLDDATEGFTSRTA